MEYLESSPVLSLNNLNEWQFLSIDYGTHQLRVSPLTKLMKELRQAKPDWLKAGFATGHRKEVVFI